MFTNFTHHQILQYTKDTKSDIHKIQLCKYTQKLYTEGYSRNISRCSTISLVINNSLVIKILSLLFPMMITIHQRNRNVSNNDDTFSKSAQNSLPWVLPDKYITDRLTIQLILSLLTSFSLFLPSTNKSLFKKSNVLLSLMTNNSSMNRISISNFTYVQISYVKYIPLLCRIWPDFIQKSSLFYQQSLGMIQTCVPIFLNSPYSLDDKIRATVQLITYTVPQNCLSIFTIHNCSIFVRVSSEAELQIFFLEGRHLSKIRLGANVMDQKNT